MNERIPLFPFYVVWCEGGGPPTVKHEDANVAAAEAKRLARQSPGQTFHVLTVIGSAVVDPVSWTTYQHDDIPF